MNVWPLALAAGGGAIAYFAFGRFSLEPDGEPSAPLAELIPPTGGSGIALDENEVEALARVIASEANSASTNVQRAIGWVVRNRFRGKSIYGVQYPWREQKGSNPPFSSARGATNSSRSLAKEILSEDQAKDPTGGATSFFEPRMQDAFAKAGALARAGETGSRVIDGVKLSDITRFKAYKKSADEVRKSWSKGSTVYAVAGPFELWGSSKLFAARNMSVQTIAGYQHGAAIPSFATVKRNKSSFNGGFYDVEAFVRDAQMTNVSGTVSYLDAVGLVGRGEI